MENHYLGSSNVTTDSSGNVIEVADYYPYGKSRIEEKSAGYTNDYLYTGKELDRSSGLYYYGARYYDPLIGRFTGVDPVLTTGGAKSGKDTSDVLVNPQMMNGYSYATGNPLKYTDPTGEFLFTVFPDLSKNLNKIANISYAQKYDPVPMNRAEKITTIIIGTLATGGVTIAYEVPKIISDLKNIIQTSANLANTTKKNAKNYYAPDRELPRDELTNRPQPDTNNPHTQLGIKKGRNDTYRQTMEWKKDGDYYKKTDWTDHGRPQDHTNPHQIKYIENKTGGTKAKTGNEPFKPSDPKLFKP